MVSPVVVPFPVTATPLVIVVPVMALPVTVPIVIPVSASSPVVAASFPVLPVLPAGVVIGPVIPVPGLVSPVAVPALRTAAAVARPRLRLLPVVLLLLPLLVMYEIVEYRRRVPIRMHYPQNLASEAKNITVKNTKRHRDHTHSTA